jgi:hypothetical protein
MGNKMPIFKIVLFFLVLSIFMFLLLGCNSEKWIEEIKMLNGDLLKLNIFYKTNYVGTYHCGFGGSKHSLALKFKYNSRKYEFKFRYKVPFIIQYYKDVFYIVMLDSRDKNNLKIEFYKYKDKITKIDKKKFPKFLAIQNRWVLDGGPYLKASLKFVAYKLDYTNDLLYRSPMINTWLQLEDDNLKLTHVLDKAKPSFIKYYIEKYIKPYWNIEKLWL